ncbi:hypothetical protein ElyMa_004480400 [Elysia marginata]|uniref:Uncharacterized protein n=1 Tax=Elysia marginata TaxID=1093978 RepID=A0AAV4HIP8_9GAST|nr:hypothetical protein ElyMa_004480400 [Elysia marginata]
MESSLIEPGSKRLEWGNPSLLTRLSFDQYVWADFQNGVRAVSEQLSFPRRMRKTRASRAVNPGERTLSNALRGVERYLHRTVHHCERHDAQIQFTDVDLPTPRGTPFTEGRASLTE